MSKRSPERIYNYNNARVGKFHDNDHVTVTLSNGCKADGIVVVGRHGPGYGMTSSLRNKETGEIVYTIQIKSGPMKGMTYHANESQLSPGWTAGAAGDVCEAGSPARQTAAAPSASKEHTADVDIDQLLASGVLVAVTLVLAYGLLIAPGRPRLA